MLHPSLPGPAPGPGQIPEVTLVTEPKAGTDGAATLDHILDLYRSAEPNVYADWGTAVGPTTAPGLIMRRTRSPLSIFSPSSGNLNSVAIRSLFLADPFS